MSVGLYKLSEIFGSFLLIQGGLSDSSMKFTHRSEHSLVVRAGNAQRGCRLHKELIDSAHQHEIARAFLLMSYMVKVCTFSQRGTVVTSRATQNIIWPYNKMYRVCSECEGKKTQETFQKQETTLEMLQKDNGYCSWFNR